MEGDYITVADARERFGLTKYKMTTLINDGAILTYDNPKDGRSKLVKVSDMEALMQPKPQVHKESAHRDDQ
jgi:hypothetical protein